MPEKKNHNFDILKAFKRGTLEAYWEKEKQTIRSIVAGSRPSWDDQEIGVAASARLDSYAYAEYRLLIKTPLSELDEEEILLRNMLPGNLDEITRYLMELCSLDTWIDEGPVISEFLAEKLAKEGFQTNWPKDKDQTGYLATSEKPASHGLLYDLPVTFGTLTLLLWDEEFSPGELIHIIALHHFQVIGHADYCFLGLGRIGVIEETGACLGLVERLIQEHLTEVDTLGQTVASFYERII